MKDVENRCWAIWLAFLLLLALPFILAGCGTKKPLIEKHTETVTIKETVHDTVFDVQPDSASIKALIECQNGKPVIKQIQQATPGRKMAPPKLTLKDGVIDCECETQLEQLRAFYKNKIVELNREKQKPLLIEKELTWWQTTQIWTGRIALLLLFIWLLTTIYNPFKFLQK